MSIRVYSWLLGFIDHETTSGTARTDRAREIHHLAAAGTYCGNHHRRCGGLLAGASGRFCVGRFSFDNGQPVAAKLLGSAGNLVRRQNGRLLSAHEYDILDRASSFRRERNRLSRCQYPPANCKCVARLAVIKTPEYSRRVAGRPYLRDPSSSCGISGVDFRVEKSARDVLRAVVGPLFS